MIFLCRPNVFGRQAFFGGLIKELVLSDTISGWQTWYSSLGTNGEVAHSNVFPDLIGGFLNISSVRMPINQHPSSTFTAQQIVNGSVQRLAFYIPQGHVHRGNRSHGYWPSTPVRPAIQVLPDVLGLKRISADEAGNYVILEIADNSKLAAIESAIAEPINTLIRVDFYGNDVSAGTRDNNLSIGYLHV